MSYNENEARHSVPSVKMTKHFIGVSDSDGDSFGTESHNPANFSVQFLNPGITNVSSASDATKTVLHPISMSMDVYYNNVSENFRNNRFRLRSSAGNLLTQTLNGVAVVENGTNPGNAPANYDPKTFPVVRIADGIYKTGADLATAIVAAFVAANISWTGGNVITWANTVYDSTTQSIRFRYATAAPAGTPTLFIESVFEDPNTGVEYDSSRVLGINGAVVGPPNFTVYTDGAFILPYATTQGAGAGVLTPSFIDLQTIDTIQVRCPEVAKRYFRKQGNNPVAGRNPLAFVPILFEVNIDASVGGTFYWSPPDERYSQEISSDFSTMTFTITDKRGNVVPINNNGEVNFQFYITREIPIASNEQRIKAMSEYNRFKSF
jgi:hypothetical protein